VTGHLTRETVREGTLRSIGVAFIGMAVAVSMVGFGVAEPAIAKVRKGCRAQQQQVTLTGECNDIIIENVDRGSKLQRALLPKQFSENQVPAFVDPGSGRAFGRHRCSWRALHQIQYPDRSRGALIFIEDFSREASSLHGNGLFCVLRRVAGARRGSAAYPPIAAVPGGAR
jgi:hypothetical protein